MTRERRWAPPPLRPYEPVIINVALTGAVPTKNDAAALPMTPEEIANDAIACAHAGASMVHVHVRDESGQPVHRRDLYERAIAGIREHVPELIICVTTSARVDGDLAARMTGLNLDPDLRPDMASLTLGSFNFPRTVSLNPPDAIEALLVAMQDRGIKPELEVFEFGMVNTMYALMDKGLIESPPYVNVLLGSFGAAPAFVGHLAHIVDQLPDDAAWAAAGIGVFQRPMVLAAVAMGGGVRTGLEDAPHPADPAQPATNVRAVEFAKDAADLLGRDVATPSETRKRLGLPSVV